MIPGNISKESVLNAIDEIKKNGIPENRHSDKYFLLHDNFLYPPKYVLSIANKFVNGEELNSTEFSGGPESNEFLENLRFNVVRKPRDLSGQKWLAVTTPENWQICLQIGTFGSDENRVNQMKRVKVGDHLLMYLKGMRIAAICKVVKEYFYDDKKIVNDGLFPHRIGISPVKIPKNSIDIKQVYDIYFKYKGASAGYFGQTIRPLPDEEFSIFQSELARNMNELPKWNDDIANDNAKRVYLTAYPQANLEISKKIKLLGWKNKSSTMAVGDLVFVYNTTTRQIETSFEIKSKSQDTTAVWQDEKKDSEEKPIYMNRWNAEIVQDDLNINLDDIYNFEPFKSNKKNFSVLLQTHFQPY